MGMVLKVIRDPRNLPICSRLLCEVGPLDLPPCTMANGKHPHRMALLFYFIDNPINGLRHSLRNAVIGSTADARLAGTRHARAATPSSKREAASRMRGFVEAFSTH